MNNDRLIKNQRIVNYVNQVVETTNSQYHNLISEELREKAIQRYVDSNMSEEEIIKEINEAVENLIKRYLNMLQIANQSKMSGEIDTKLHSENQGVYVSGSMVEALALINCGSINEVNEWINNIPNLYMVPNIVSDESQLDTIKRQLFNMYQDSKISTLVVNELNNTNVLESKRFALHKKLSGLNLPIEEELRIGDIGLQQGLDAMYSEIERICVDTYGMEKGLEISNKIMKYHTTDSENFTSVSFDQINALNDKFKENMKMCKDKNGSYQLVIQSLCYGNTVTSKSDGSLTYDFGVSVMGQKLAQKLGMSYRLRSMLNRNTAEELASMGLNASNKEQIIAVLRDSLRGSLQSFADNIEKDSKNNTYELFNELIEINKPDRNYRQVWDAKFGISLEDLVTRVVNPNIDLIKQLKDNNVDFMYNETLLQESSEKRDKVMATMKEITKLSPGLITVFGDQDHTFLSDYSDDKIGELKATAQFDQEMSNLDNGKGEKIKIECSERDLHFSKQDISFFKQTNMSDEKILKYKQSLFNIHDEIYKDVKFKRENEWTVLDNIDGEYLGNRLNINEKSYGGKYTDISNMVNNVNSAKVQRDVSEYQNWKSSMEQIHSSKQDVEYQKNMPKTKVLKPAANNNSSTSENSSGFANVFVLSLLVGFFEGIVFVLTYLFINK